MNPKPDKFIPALYGGIIMAVISTVPFISFINCLCCAGILSGGFLAVFFYKNNFTPDTQPFTSADCMTVGALAGVVGAIIGMFLSMAFMAMFGNIMMQTIIEILHNMNVELPDEAWESLEESLNAKLSPVMMVINFFGSLVIDAIFGLLGGLIAYSVYKPKNQVMPPPPMPQPL